MKKISILLLLLSSFFIGGCGDKNTVTQSIVVNPNHSIKIYAIGDSLTAGYQLPIEQSWPSQLEVMLQNAGFKNYKIINAGKSGDTSKQVKDRLQWSISDAQTGDIVILTVGGNDGFQSVPVETLEQNIREIVDTLQKKGMSVVIGGMQISTNLGSTYTTEFAAIYPRIANDTNSILIPFILKGVALRPELNLSDMIHPNEAGYKIIAETILKKLEKSNLINK